MNENMVLGDAARRGGGLPAFGWVAYVVLAVLL